MEPLRRQTSYRRELPGRPQPHADRAAHPGRASPRLPGRRPGKRLEVSGCAGAGTRGQLRVLVEQPHGEARRFERHGVDRSSPGRSVNSQGPGTWGRIRAWPWHRPTGGEVIVNIEQSDALKISDALQAASAFLEARDRMNAQVHLAREVRFSPLTSEVVAARDRLGLLLGIEVLMPGGDGG